MSVSFDFTGKVVLITGSSSGIGAETAILLSKAGAKVVVTGRNADKVHSVAKQCSDVSPNRVKALEVVADVTEEVDCKRLIEITVEEFGQLDVLVNNAGAGMKVDITDPEYLNGYKSALDTNLNSIVYLTHISVEHLAKTKGNIINISSTASVMAAETFSPYCMIKCALDMFTRCMAVELASKGIRVNTIAPGYTRTNILEAIGLSKKESDAFFDAGAGKSLFDRTADTEEIANAIMFFASDQAAFMTGTRLFVDGGYSAHLCGI